MRLTHMAVPTLAFALFGTTLAATGTLAAQYGPPPSPPTYAQGGWDAPPPEFREAQRQGFHDGVEGARHDFDNHRRPDPNNRDEYRHPHVPRSLRDDYREGFRRGYDVAMRHMLGEQRPY